MRFLNVFVLMLVVTAALFSISTLSTADGNVSDIRLHVSGPDVLGVDDTGDFTATLVDSQTRDWNYTVFVTAENTTGAQPLEESPVTGNLTAGNKTFSFSITATSDPMELTIVINLSSPSGLQWYVAEEDVTVVNPIDLAVEIYNPGSVKINNATVEFLVDDELIDTQVLTTLEPKSSIDLSTKWISKSYNPGWHKSKVIVDVNDDGVIDPSIGDMVVSNDFYVKGVSSSVILLFMIGFIAIIGGIFIISRKMKGR